MGEAGLRHEVLDLEAAALARWCRGDPSGFLEVADDDVAYFDPFLATRIDGKAALTAYYEGLRGKISAVSWEIVEPRVIEIGDVAVLTFRFRSRGSVGGEATWNATEVWRRRREGWKIIHTHWSFSPSREGTAAT
jgi:ketosteroid isomerase-like protein